MARRKDRHDPEPASPESLSYEDAIAELESIIDRIERGDIGLEESLRQFERGDALVRRCDAALRVAEQKVEQIDRRRLAELDEIGRTSGNGADIDGADDSDGSDADDEEPL